MVAEPSSAESTSDREEFLDREARLADNPGFDESPPALDSRLSALDSPSPLDTADQWQVRRTDDEGETCEGSLRVHLGRGERDATLHIAFCPPLATTPTVELEDVDGLGWELKATTTYPYGLRLTVRRPPRQTADETGRIAYWASAAKPSQQRAA
jgi:hypothetical protein